MIIEKLKLYDYGISAFGILGALHNLGIFGEVIKPIRVIIFVISTTVVLCAGSGILFRRYTRHMRREDASYLPVLTNSVAMITSFL